VWFNSYKRRLTHVPHDLGFGLEVELGLPFFALLEMSVEMRLKMDELLNNDSLSSK
jgi:hypothetical protein